jgi:hypothetical protein
MLVTIERDRKSEMVPTSHSWERAKRERRVEQTVWSYHLCGLYTLAALNISKEEDHVCFIILN